MERSEISEHEVRIYLSLKRAEKWLTSKQIATVANVCSRTARAHLLKLSGLGLLDVAEVFPGHRYKMSEHAQRRNQAYVSRLEKAIEVLGAGE